MLQFLHALFPIHDGMVVFFTGHRRHGLFKFMPTYFDVYAEVLLVYFSLPKLISDLPCILNVSRRVYWWFLLVHKISYAGSVGGYFLVLFSLFIPTLIDPSFAIPVGGLILFYGVYYGLVARDFAEVCTDKMAAHISVSS